jgi:hypothetical protein
MSTRDDAIPAEFIKLLRKLRPELKAEPIKVQQALAYLAWVSPMRSRAHNELEGYISIPYQELSSLFGRSAFKALNERVRLFNVTPNWSKERGVTRGYRLQDDLELPVRKYLDAWWRRGRKIERTLIGLDGNILHSIPQAIASKDMNGVTAKAWNRAAVKNLVPVDVLRLRQYRRQLKRMIDEPQADLFIRGNVSDYQYRLDMMGHIMDRAREQDGQQCVIQRYEESGSGRLYGKNITLQTVPKSIKEVALHGLWEYDFANCHYSILYQLAARLGIECKAIGNYLKNKRQVRQQIVTDVGINVDQAKTCLISLIYGARFSRRDEDAIPVAVGKKAALRLYQHPLFQALKEDVTRARNGIIRKWPRSRLRLKNAYGKWIPEKENPLRILAHLLQGIEASMLEAVRKLYPHEILLLQHDGFASAVRLDIARMEQSIHEATGYRMQIEENRISLSPDLGIHQR